MNDCHCCVEMIVIVLVWFRLFLSVLWLKLGFCCRNWTSIAGSELTSRFCQLWLVSTGSTPVSRWKASPFAIADDSGGEDTLLRRQCYRWFRAPGGMYTLTSNRYRAHCCLVIRQFDTISQHYFVFCCCWVLGEVGRGRDGGGGVHWHCDSVLHNGAFLMWEQCRPDVGRSDLVT